MKLFIIFAFVATFAAVHAVLTEEQKAKLMQFVNECKETTKVTDDEVNKLRNGELPDDPKCFLNCLLEKVGIAKDGVLLDSTTLAKFAPNIDPAKAKQIFDMCRGEKGANKCESGLKLHKCLRSKKEVVQ